MVPICTTGMGKQMKLKSLQHPTSKFVPHKMDVQAAGQTKTTDDTDPNVTHMDKTEKLTYHQQSR